MGAAACGATAEPGAQEPPPATATATGSGGTPVVEAVTLLAAGDIGNCEDADDELVAALAASLPGTFIIAGDIAGNEGLASEYAECIDPVWGELKERMRPAPGNHDYGSGNADGYFAYFGPAVGEPGKGWYAFDAGAWRAIALNSNCRALGDGCDVASEQYRWLEAELDASAAKCTLAYWHHPRFTSGLHGENEKLDALWRLLAEHDVDVVVNGHDQHYERFAPLDGEGSVDLERGMRLFIAGTGGADLFPVLRAAPGSEVRNVATHGVLRFELSDGAYRWEFVPAESGGFTDSGDGTCH